jgi:hypothetical protein
LIESNPASAPVAVDIYFGELRQVVVKHMLDEVEMVAFLKTFGLGNCISVKEAVEYSGYSSQYLFRLLQLCKLVGLKLSQLWLIEMEYFEAHLVQVENSKDHCFGPKRI